MNTRKYSGKTIAAVNNTETTGLGVELGRLCIARGYSVMEVAEVLGVSRQTIYHWFKGRGHPGGRYLQKVQSLVEKLRPSADA